MLIPTSQTFITTEELYNTVEIDVTSLVNEWLSGMSPNNDVLVLKELYNDNQNSQELCLNLNNKLADKPYST